jgi:hypothetical protein
MASHTNMHGMAQTTQTSLYNGSKKQFYGTDGTGRDAYIHRDNGGFCPPTTNCQVEGIGKYFSSKFRLIRVTLC